MATIVGGAALVLSAAGSAEAVIIDFETVPGVGASSDGLTITNQYSGVDFSIVEEGVESSPQLFEGFGQNNFRLFNTDDGASTRADILRLDFDQPSSVNLDLSPQGNQGPQIRLDAFDSFGTLLESVTNPSATDFRLLYPMSFSSTNISRIDIFQPNDSWLLAIDNLDFTSSASVPFEFSPTFGLVAMGGIFGLSRLRKRIGNSKKEINDISACF